MQPLAHQVRQPAHRQNVAAAIERHAVLEAQPLAACTFAAIGSKRRIIGLEGVPRLAD